MVSSVHYILSTKRTAHNCSTAHPVVRHKRQCADAPLFLVLTIADKARTYGMVGRNVGAKAFAGRPRPTTARPPTGRLPKKENASADGAPLLLDMVSPPGSVPSKEESGGAHHHALLQGAAMIYLYRRPRLPPRRSPRFQWHSIAQAILSPTLPLPKSSLGKSPQVSMIRPRNQ